MRDNKCSIQQAAADLCCCVLQDVKSRSWLVRTYYKHRLFMGFCCICCEVLYLSMYLLSWQQYKQWALLPLPAQLVQHLEHIPGAEALSSTGGVPLIAVLALLALPGTMIKQVCNWVQLSNAAQGLVEYDLQKMQ
jgi:CDP-diacylglycerol--inositol 3-phosphatidyltransferase